MESEGIPLLPLILIMFVMPVGIALFFGLFAFKHLVPLAFHCRRCNREFRRKSWRRFPQRCPHCGAGDWNL